MTKEESEVLRASILLDHIKSKFFWHAFYSLFCGFHLKREESYSSFFERFFCSLRKITRIRRKKTHSLYYKKEKTWKLRTLMQHKRKTKILRINKNY
jgi:hypothetical protein